jgi:hypothetical protein
MVRVPSSTIGVLGNDTDADDIMSATLVAGPYHGTLDLNADGTFRYAPAAGFAGVDQFTYRANDGVADSGLTLVTLNVGEVTFPPTAAEDRYVIWGGRPLASSVLSGVLANDSDVNADSLSASIVEHPLSGVVSLAADGSFVYTPEDGFTGVDYFEYRVDDGAGGGDVAQAVVHVLGVRDPVDAIPRARDDAFEAGSAGIAMGAANLLSNDSDPEGEPVSIAVISPPWHGTLQVGANGTFRYVPLAGFTGTDTFTYRISDGNTFSAPAVVTIETHAGPQPTPATLVGDVDRDGDVDRHDLALTMALFGQHVGTPRYNAAADIDKNGRIGIDDVVAVRNRIGGAPPATTTIKAK